MEKINLTEQDYFNHMNMGIGYCISCGEIQDGCEPDARNYNCITCEKDDVYGIDELLQMDCIRFVYPVEP